MTGNRLYDADDVSIDTSLEPRAMFDGEVQYGGEKTR
jgi:hypothetical protein